MALRLEQGGFRFGDRSDLAPRSAAGQACVQDANPTTVGQGKFDGERQLPQDALHLVLIASTGPEWIIGPAVLTQVPKKISPRVDRFPIRADLHRLVIPEYGAEPRLLRQLEALNRRGTAMNKVSNREEAISRFVEVNVVEQAVEHPQASMQVTNAEVTARAVLSKADEG